MLALTENVTEIVNELTEEVPGISALRIATEPDGEALSVSPAEAAAPGHHLVADPAPPEATSQPFSRPRGPRGHLAGRSRRAERAA